MRLYNPVIAVNNKLEIDGHTVGIALNNVVREVAPRAYDDHTGDGNISNQVIYPASNGMPPRMVTYLKAGTFGNLTLCLKNLLTLIGQSSDTSLQIKAFILSYLKPNHDYNVKQFTSIISKRFGINTPTVDSNINDLINQKILVLTQSNQLKLIKKPKAIDITNRNDRYTKQFRSTITKLIINKLKQNKEKQAKQVMDKDNQLAKTNHHKRIQGQRINHKIDKLAVHPIIKHISKKRLPKQLSIDIIDNNDSINKTYYGKTTKKYKQSILILNHLFTNHIHTFKSKNLNHDLKQNVSYALSVLRKSNYFKYNHNKHTYQFNTNSIWLCICHPDKKTTVLTLNLAGKNPKMIRYIIK